MRIYAYIYIYMFVIGVRCECKFSEYSEAFLGAEFAFAVFHLSCQERCGGGGCIYTYIHDSRASFEYMYVPEHISTQ